MSVLVTDSAVVEAAGSKFGVVAVEEMEGSDV